MRSSTVAQQGEHGDERSPSPAASLEDAAPKSAPSHGRNSRSRAFDQELGARVRAARIRLGMNQTALGAAIQVSFQQIQKYESGRDRISAATLLRIADVLKAPVAAFFDDGCIVSTAEAGVVTVAASMPVVTASACCGGRGRCRTGSARHARQRSLKRVASAVGVA